MKIGGRGVYEECIGLFSSDNRMILQSWRFHCLVKYFMVQLLTIPAGLGETLCRISAACLQSAGVCRINKWWSPVARVGGRRQTVWQVRHPQGGGSMEASDDIMEPPRVTCRSLSGWSSPGGGERDSLSGSVCTSRPADSSLQHEVKSNKPGPSLSPPPPHPVTPPPHTPHCLSLSSNELFLLIISSYY